MKLLLKKNHKLSKSALIAGSSLALLLSACGSSTATSSSTTTSAPVASSTSGASSGGVAAASAELAKYSSTAAPIAPGPAFNASKAAGKLVWIVEQLAANPVVGEVAQQAQAALQHENVRVLTCDARGVSVAIGTCMQQGISQHAAALLIVGGDPSAFASGISAANAAHVPVISALDVPLTTSLDSSVVTPLLKGLAGNAAPPDLLSGTLAADYIIKASNANAHILFINSPGIIGGTFEEKSFAQTLKKLCPKCTLDLQNVIITNWASDLGPTVSAQLQLHPSINYVVPVFDPMAAYTDPAIAQAGKSSTVKVVTVNGSIQQMTNLSQSQSIVAEIGQDLPELGFQATDEVLRAVTGQSGAETSIAPAVRVFTQANIGSITISPAAAKSGEWYTGSPTALQDMYYKLWSGK